MENFQPATNDIMSKAQIEMEKYFNANLPSTDMTEQVKKVINNCKMVKNRYVSSHYSMEEMTSKIQHLVALFSSVIDFKFQEIYDVFKSGKVMAKEEFNKYIEEQLNIMQQLDNLRINLKETFGIDTIVSESTEALMAEAKKIRENLNPMTSIDQLPDDFLARFNNKIYRIRRREDDVVKV